MDGKGGCCVARYAGGGGGTYDMSKMNEIMLRFRPIAPKPATCGSVPGGSTPEKGVKIGRRKRKYVRESASSGSGSNSSSNNNSKRCNKKRKASSEETAVTLPLLPETPERKDSPARSSLSDAPIWLNCKNIIMNNPPLYVPDHRTVVMPQAVKILGSCVTVERVTDTWMNENELGFTDEERGRSLERDTCPAFISDGMNRVTWTNGAYRRMVMGEEEEEGEMMVWLVMKERVPVTCPAFTCRARMQYTCSGRKEKISLTLPCDVWRIDGGGFAWRLDVKAALRLGR